MSHIWNQREEENMSALRRSFSMEPAQKERVWEMIQQNAGQKRPRPIMQIERRRRLVVTLTAACVASIILAAGLLPHKQGDAPLITQDSNLIEQIAEVTDITEVTDEFRTGTTASVTAAAENNTDMSNSQKTGTMIYTTAEKAESAVTSAITTKTRTTTTAPEATSPRGDGVIIVQPDNVTALPGEAVKVNFVLQTDAAIFGWKLSYAVFAVPNAALPEIKPEVDLTAETLSPPVIKVHNDGEISEVAILMEETAFSAGTVLMTATFVIPESAAPGTIYTLLPLEKCQFVHLVPLGDGKSTQEAMPLQMEQGTITVLAQ